MYRKKFDLMLAAVSEERGSKFIEEVLYYAPFHVQKTIIKDLMDSLPLTEEEIFNYVATANSTPIKSNKLLGEI